MESSSFIIGAFRVDVDGNRIQGPDGDEKLEVLTMEVLRCLVRHQGQVVSVNRIVDEVWRGGVVSDNAVHKRVAQLRKVLGDAPQEPAYIETIPRRGYRLLKPVEVADFDNGESRSRRFGPWAVASMTVVVALVLLAGWYVADRRERAAAVDTTVGRAGDGPSPPRTLLVLPLKARSFDNPVLQEILADELRSILIEDSQLQVMSRRSAIEIAESGQDPRRLGPELGIELLIEGVLLGAGDNRVYLSLTAMDLASGFEVWGERYELSGADDSYAAISAARRAGLALRQRLVGGHPDISVAPPFEDAQLLRDYLLARHHLGSNTPESLASAASLFRRLLAAVPDSFDATLGLGQALVQLAALSAENRDDLLAEAEFLGERASRQRADVPEVAALLGWIRYARGQQAIGLKELQMAVSTNPDMPWAQERLARALISANRPREALETLQAAIRLHPLDAGLSLRLADIQAGLGDRAGAVAVLNSALKFPQGAYETKLALAQIAYQYGRFDEAIGWAKDAARVAGEDYRPAARLSLALAALGRFDAARQWADVAAARSPRAPFVRSARFYVAYFEGTLSDSSVVDEVPDLTQVRTLSLEERVALGHFAFSRLTVGDWEGSERALRRLDLLADQRAVTQAADLFLMGSWLLAAERVRAADLTTLRSDCLSVVQTTLDAGWNLPEIHYYAARLFALAGMAERAERHFAEAGERGWRHYQAMVADPARERLEHLAAFQALRDTAASSLEEQRRRADALLGTPSAADQSAVVR